MDQLTYLERMLRWVQILEKVACMCLDFCDISKPLITSQINFQSRAKKPKELDLGGMLDAIKYPDRTISAVLEWFTLSEGMHYRG